MKSAYELAMERLQKEAPTVELTPAQKEQIAEVESASKARIAEQELFLGEQSAKARAAGRLEEAASLEQQLVGEIRRIREAAEAKKEKIRTGAA